MIARIVGLCAIACLRVATAAPAVKHHPDKLTAAASEAYDRAVAAQQHGNLAKALAAYEEAFELSPHPDTLYNKAGLLAQLGRDHEALIAYQMYLDMRPDAADRAQVEATMNAMMTRPRSTVIEVENPQLANAYVLVDGDIVAKPGDVKNKHHLTVPIVPGEHVIAVVTPISYGAETVTLRSDRDKVGGTITVYVPLRSDGNVAVTGPYPFEIEVGGKKVLNIAKKFQVPKGDQPMVVSQGNLECPMSTLTATDDGSVIYVHLQPTELRDRGGGKRCRTFTVKQQHLVFQ